MFTGKNIVHSDVVTKATKDALIRRGVTLEDIAKIVYEMQVPYNEGLDLAECVDSVERVLRKRELQHAILVGIELDELANKASYPLRCNRSLHLMKDCLAWMKPSL